MQCRSDDFLAVAELLVGALRQGYRVVEHPMLLTARRHGRSKAVIARLIKDHTLFLWRLSQHGVRIPHPTSPVVHATQTRSL